MNLCHLFIIHDFGFEYTYVHNKYFTYWSSNGLLAWIGQQFPYSILEDIRSGLCVLLSAHHLTQCADY